MKTIFDQVLGNHELRGIDCRPRQRSDVVCDTQGDRLVLRRDGATFELGRFGRDLWALCDGQRAIDEIVDRLLPRHELVESHCRVDAVVLLHQLEREGFVEAPRLVEVPSPRKWIDLRTMKFFVLNCADRTDRRDFMAAQLERMGFDFEFVPGIVAQPLAIAISLSHLKILTRQGISPPFGILEDDCEFNRDFEYLFEVPIDADALYLGVSHFGNRRPGDLSRYRWRNVRWVRFDDHLLRVFNMFAAHAVVCLSDVFLANAVRAVMLGLMRGGPGRTFPVDNCYAMLHASHLVLTPARLVCRQYGALGGAQSATELPLDHVWPQGAGEDTQLGYGPAPDD